jgi:hypothetical protein
MRKKGLSLDFSNISGESETKKQPRSQVALSGIEILLQGEESLEAIDLAEATHQEFIDWCGIIYPGLTLKEEDVDTLEKKVAIFNRIATLGGYNMFSRSRPEQMPS